VLGLRTWRRGSESEAMVSRHNDTEMRRTPRSGFLSFGVLGLQFTFEIMAFIKGIGALEVCLERVRCFVSGSLGYVTTTFWGDYFGSLSFFFFSFQFIDHKLSGNYFFDTW
jgi:hypothetical protein